MKIQSVAFINFSNLCNIWLEVLKDLVAVQKQQNFCILNKILMIQSKFYKS